MTIEGVKQNPEATREDLRRMALVINNIIKDGNSGSIARISLTSTGSVVTDEGLASIYYVNATDANVVFNLADLPGVLDRYISVHRLDGSTNTITLTPASTAQFINDAATLVITGKNVSRDLHARNITNWNVI